MVTQRFPTSKPAKSTVLGERLNFKSGRSASNRLLKASMSEMVATYSEQITKTGIPSDRLINLFKLSNPWTYMELTFDWNRYAKWAHGGFGMVCTGNFIVDHRHIEGPGNVVLSRETDSDEKREQLKRLAAAMKSGGSLAIAQLNHCGRQTPSNVNATPFSASDVQLTKRIKTTFGKPIPLSVEQIQTEVVDRFVFAARQCFDAGFDGVEIHASFGHLLTQFLSPTTNLRTDQYGGSPSNRARVVQEIYRDIRVECPAASGFIVGIKLNSADSQTGSLDEVIEIACIFDRLGFDFIEITGGSFEKITMFHYKESTKQREAFFLEFSAALKPVIRNAVVYLTGGFRTVPAMVRAVERGEVDGVGLAKPAAAEPDIADKILNGGVQSVAFNRFETDFGMAGIQAIAQMAQAGRTTWSQSDGDPCYGISDLSGQEAAAKFQEGALGYLLSVMKFETKEGRPYVGVFEYDEKQNYSFCGSFLVRWIFSAFSRHAGLKQ